MSILTNIYVKLFNFECCVSLSKSSVANGTESNRLNLCFADKRNSEISIGALFITSSSSPFFNKSYLEQSFLKLIAVAPTKNRKFEERKLRFEGSTETFLYPRFGICLILSRNTVLCEICVINKSLQNCTFSFGQTFKNTSFLLIKLFTLKYVFCLFQK